MDFAPNANWEAIAFLFLWITLVTIVGLTMDQINSEDKQDDV